MFDSQGLFMDKGAYIVKANADNKLVETMVKKEGFGSGK